MPCRHDFARVVSAGSHAWQRYCVASDHCSWPHLGLPRPFGFIGLCQRENALVPALGPILSWLSVTKSQLMAAGRRANLGAIRGGLVLDELPGAVPYIGHGWAAATLMVCPALPVWGCDEPTPAGTSIATGDAPVRTTVENSGKFLKKQSCHLILARRTSLPITNSTSS